VNTPLVTNSFCGAMIIATALRRLNVKYKHLYGWLEDEKFKRGIRKINKGWSKFGLVGYQSLGFHYVSFDLC
jgi:hypothetical protein